MQRNSNPLKAGSQCLEANMPPDLLNKMVIPMPAEALDQIIAR
jgi:hypothetical protein